MWFATAMKIVKLPHLLDLVITQKILFKSKMGLNPLSDYCFAGNIESIVKDRLQWSLHRHRYSPCISKMQTNKRVSYDPKNRVFLSMDVK